MPVHTTFIGGGPAGLAPLVWAARQGILPQLAERGLVIVERQERLGSGTIGQHAISSDTLSETFIECLDNTTNNEFAELRNHPAALQVAAYRGGGMPLPEAAVYLDALGETMQRSIRSSGGRILTSCTATQAQLCADGGWRIQLRSIHGQTELRSRNLVLATGATESRSSLCALKVAGEPLVPRYLSKLMLSGEVLAADGPSAVIQLLLGKKNPKVVVIGGSHSAVAAANVLLNKCADINFGRGAITLIHRRPLRVFYPSTDEAVADGYTDFTADDICPASKRLFRLAGFRLESRELVMRALGIGGRPSEPRLRLHHLNGEDALAAARGLLDEADLIITALGYRPNALTLLDVEGRAIPLPRFPSPLVDQASRVLNAEGKPIPGTFGIGLAAGFVPSGPLGGERSFRGQTNGLWLWQNGVGAMIVNSLLEQRMNHVADATAD